MARITMSEADYHAYLARAGRTAPDSENRLVKVQDKKKTAKGPNKTEQRFARDMLEIWRHEGRFIEYRWEPCAWKIILDHGQAHTYRPDFMAWDSEGRTYVFEVKGARVWDGAKDKFLRARREFPWWTWQAWQWKGGEWTEIWEERGNW